MHENHISDTIDVCNWDFIYDKYIQTKRIQAMFQSFFLYEGDSVFLIFNHRAAYSPDRMQPDDLRSKSRNV